MRSSTAGILRRGLLTTADGVAGVAYSSYSCSQYRHFGGLWAALTQKATPAVTDTQEVVRAAAVNAANSSSNPAVDAKASGSNGQSTTNGSQGGGASTSSVPSLKKALLAGRRAAMSHSGGGSSMGAGINTNVVAVERVGAGPNQPSSVSSSLAPSLNRRSARPTLQPPQLPPSNGTSLRYGEALQPQRATDTPVEHSSKTSNTPTIVVSVNAATPYQSAPFNELSSANTAAEGDSSLAVADERNTTPLDRNGNHVLTKYEARVAKALGSTRALMSGIAQIRPPTMAKQSRSSSVRYKADVRAGQHKYTVEMLKVIRHKKDPRLSLEEAIHQQCDFLNPRERLDLLRLAAQVGGGTSKHRRVHKGKAPNKVLPKYWSEEFQKKYFFQEEDIDEKSALGTGPGGQATNRRMQTVLLKHIPTNIVIRYSHFPSLYANRKAARAILNLKLEYLELGDASVLGQKELAKKERAERLLKERNKLERLSAGEDRKVKHKHRFLGFLHGHFHLPSIVVPQCELLLGRGAAAVANGEAKTAEGSKPNTTTTSAQGSKQLVTVTTFIDTHANRWWNILSESFYNHWCRPATVKTYVRTPEERMIVRRKVMGWTIGATKHVPSWFCYFFPIVCKAPKPLTRPSDDIIRLASATKQRRLKALASPIPKLETVPSGSTMAMVMKSDPEEVVAATVAADASTAITATSSPTNQVDDLVHSLITEEMAAQNALAAKEQEARDIFFDYLKQKKKYDVVARSVQFHAEQLAQLKQLPEGKKAVLSAVNAVVEVFGLFLEDTNTAGVPMDLGTVRSGVSAAGSTATLPKYRLVKDPGNWRTYKERLYTKTVVAMESGSGQQATATSTNTTTTTTHITPIASAVFPHMIKSLKRLDMHSEAEAIEAFFAAHLINKKTGSKRRWASEMMDLIAAEDSSE